MRAHHGQPQVSTEQKGQNEILKKEEASCRHSSRQRAG
jgi:hypothetical protein